MPVGYSIIKFFFTFVGILSILCTSGERNNPFDADGNSFIPFSQRESYIVTHDDNLTDVDGNVYTTIKIGNQVWTVENLRTTKYNDGTAIPHVTDSVVWKNITTPGYCFYENNNSTTEKTKWGALYNWYAVNTGKLAPKGWHVPTDSDWIRLENYLTCGYYDGRCTQDKNVSKSLAAETDWTVVDNDLYLAYGSFNSSGFSALPTGHRSSEGGFNGRTSTTSWWSSTPRSKSSGLAGNYEVSEWGTYEGLIDSYKNCGCSIRLGRD